MICRNCGSTHIMAAVCGTGRDFCIDCGTRAHNLAQIPTPEGTT